MVYLIHFDKPYKHAKHYIGFCEEGNLESRIESHKKSTGAKLLQVLNENGIGYEIVRVWPNKDRKFERKLKNQKKPLRFCPKCNPKTAYNNKKD